MVHFYHKVDYRTEKEYRVNGPGFDRQVPRKPRPVGGELHLALGGLLIARFPEVQFQMTRPMTSDYVKRKSFS
jgi:hypothetical protein